MRRALQEFEERWGLALQTASFGVWDLDVRAGTVHYSAEWKASLGYPDDGDAFNSTDVWRSRVHDDDLLRMLGALDEHLEGDAPTYEAEFRLRAADGSYRWVLSRGRVVARDEHGAPVRAVGTLTDLTDRREAERLRIERDAEAASSRAKSDFLSRMSHEFRTPLNAVLGFSQLLSQRLDPTADEAQLRYVKHIERAGWHLLEMIEDVLDFARLESGRLVFDLGTVPLRAALEGAVVGAEPLAKEAGVHLDVADVPAHAAVHADDARLRQVLRNLLLNAVKHGRHGGVVSVWVSPAGEGWSLAVRDTGRVIPAAQLPSLFEPFHARGQSPEGVDDVGIGLALARGLVVAMAGVLTVQSTEDVGSTFAVTLPGARP